MNTENLSGDSRIPLEDTMAAIREGRPLRPAHAYRITVADKELHARHVEISDPVPTGRQILQAAGVRKVENYSIFAILKSGDFEDVRLDETFDLRGRGAERFVIFETDRTFKFTIDDRHVQWGSQTITARILKLLAGVPIDTYQVFLEVRGGDELVRDDQPFDLGRPGVERFITLMRQTTEGLLVLPDNDRRYVESHGLTAEMMSEGGHTAVILKGIELPGGKFNHTATDILVILPPGYPDVAPDMFYCDPWLTLVSAGRHPTCADVPHQFLGRKWQRWSRHNQAWRPGVDGLHTMIKRIEFALEEAR